MSTFARRARKGTFYRRGLKRLIPKHEPLRVSSPKTAVSIEGAHPEGLQT